MISLGPVDSIKPIIMLDIFPFYLAEYGLGEEVVLIEQGMLGGGTATNATGLLGVLKLNHQETKIAMTSIELYR